MKTLFSISKNNWVYKLNTKLRCPCHLLHIDPAAGRIFRLLQMRSWYSGANKVDLHNKKTTSNQYTLPIVGALTFPISSEVTKRLHLIILFFKVMTANSDFLLIQVGKITPKGCMNTVKFGKFSLFLEQDYEQQTIPCLLTVRVNRY